MITAGASPTNQEKLARLETLLEQMLARVLERGFYGAAAVEIKIQDGTIQSIHCKVEQIER